MVVLAPSVLDQDPAFRIADLTVILALPALAGNKQANAGSAKITVKSVIRKAWP